jgi:uncharacterized protein (TIGR03118 family)
MRQGNTGAVLGIRLHTGNTHPHGRRLGRRGGAALILATGLVAVMAGTTSVGANAASTAKAHSDNGMFRQVNLVSDVPGMATILDPEVKNPWGIAFGPKKTPTPLWVSNQFNPASDCGSPDCIPAPEDLLTKVTLYSGANGVNPIAKVPLEVQASSPTGIVFNPSSDFVINQAGTDTPARFIFNETFVNESGTAPEGRITGWSNVPAPAPSTTSTDARQDPGLPFGLALVPKHNGHPAHLLVADGITGSVTMYDTNFALVTKPGRFEDPNAEADGLAAYNVMFLKGKVYVAYFANSGGAVSVFTRQGVFVKRLVTGDPLDAPWGMAISPKGWNGVGRSLLVANVDDGTINAFGLGNGRFRGTLSDADGNPLINPGLWGIAFGNGVIGTPRSLIFAAGVGSEVGGFGDDIYEHGLVGLIEPLNRHDEVD